MASHLLVKAMSVGPAGFRDGAAHRQPLAAIYDLCSRCSAEEPALAPPFDDAQLLVRPLLTTAFPCVDFLQAQICFGASRIVISSASSKTAYATAHQLKVGAAVERVGLTSPANRTFVESTGCYHRVVGYGELGQLDSNVPTRYLGFAVSEDLRTAVRQQLGDALVYDGVVGATQNSPASMGTRWLDPRPVFFFAPDQGQKRMAEWGPAVFRQRVGQAQIDFLQAVSARPSSMLTLVHGQGGAGQGSGSLGG